MKSLREILNLKHIKYKEIIMTVLTKENTFELKLGNKPKDLLMMTPKMFLVWGHFLLFANERDLPIVITNIF